MAMRPPPPRLTSNHLVGLVEAFFFCLAVESNVDTVASCCIYWSGQNRGHDALEVLDYSAVLGAGWRHTAGQHWQQNSQNMRINTNVIGETKRVSDFLGCTLRK